MQIRRREKPGSDWKQDRSTCSGTRIRRSKGRTQYSRTSEASHLRSPACQAIRLLKVSTQKRVIPIMAGWLVLPQLVDPRVNMEADVTALDIQRSVVYPSSVTDQLLAWAQAKPLEFWGFNWNSLMWNFIWELWVTVSLKIDDIYIYTHIYIYICHLYHDEYSHTYLGLCIFLKL